MAIFPVKAVMEFHRTDKPLGTIVMNLPLCDEHADEAVSDGPFALFPREHVEVMAKAMNAKAQVKLDIDATKCVRMTFDHPDYQRLLQFGSKPPQ